MPDFLSPENSFIQFLSIADADAGTETCNTILQKCLPIHYGYDFAFQIYMSGEIDAWLEDNYVVKLVAADGTDISDDIGISWFYDSVTNLSWGNVSPDFDISALAAIGNGACANFEIYHQHTTYTYGVVVGPWGATVTLKITIDGVLTTIGILTNPTTADITSAVTGFLGADAVVTQIGSDIVVVATAGHNYGDLVLNVLADGTFTYPPSAVVFTDVDPL